MGMSETERDTVFISHANPEDNEFAQWLSLRLVNEGYKVWSDVTKLIGGEAWWTEVEDALRKATAKFLFVLSRVSNRKDGTLKELQLADTVRKALGIKDFIIPMRLDDIAHQDMNVLIHRLNAISFTENWAYGLGRLLEKLLRDTVPRNTTAHNAALASSWWESNRGGYDLITPGPEVYLSNWFAIDSLPKAICIHRLDGHTWQPDPEGFPATSTGEYLISFASQRDLGLSGASTTVVSTTEVFSRKETWFPLDKAAILNAAVNMLRQAWDNAMADIGLPFYTMANERKCHFFTEAIVGDKKLISFSISDDIRGKRSLVGVSGKKFWHFGISAHPQLEPVLAFIVRYHVLFSSDKATIWESTRALHRARRATCKSWWNDEWRDRLLLSLYWIAQKGGEQDVISLDLSSENKVKLSILPVRFQAPIAYDDAKVKSAPILNEEDDFLDQSDEVEG